MTEFINLHPVCGGLLVLLVIILVSVAMRPTVADRRLDREDKSSLDEGSGR